MITAVMVVLLLLLTAVPFSTQAAAAKYKLKNAYIQMRETYTYIGEAVVPELTVYGQNWDLLKKNVDYTVSCKNHKNVGIATAVLKGKGNYKGTVKKTFTILPSGTNFRLATAEGNTVTLTWKPVTKQVTGYILTYGKEGTSKKKHKTIKINSNQTDSYTFTGLKERTEYAFSIKTYTTVNGTDYVSEESNRTVQTGQAPLYPSCDVTKEADVTVSQNIDLNTILDPSEYGLTDYQWVSGETGDLYPYEGWVNPEYTGRAIAYLVSDAPKFVGRVILHVHGKDISNAVITGLKNVTYDGYEKTPEPVVKLDGELLREYADYDWYYEDNLNAGTAKVCINGTGEYEGTVTAKFQILPAKMPIKIGLKKRTVIISPYRKTAQTLQLGPEVSAGAAPTVILESVTPAKGKKYFSVSSKGAVTVSNKTKAGTYKIKVRVVSKASRNYQKTEKPFTCTLTVRRRGKANYPSFAAVGISGIDQVTEKRANKVLDNMLKDLYDAGIDFFHVSTLKKARYVARYVDTHYPYMSAYVNGQLVEARLGTTLSLMLQKGYGDCWGFSDTKRCLLRKVGVKNTWCSIAGRLDINNTNHVRCIVKVGKKYYELNEDHGVNLIGWYRNITGGVYGYDPYFVEISKDRALYLIGKGPYKKGI